MLALLYVTTAQADADSKSKAKDKTIDLVTQAVLGAWVVPDGSALIEIYPVTSDQNSKQIAVRIIALRDGNFTEQDVHYPDKAMLGTPRLDIHNPKKSKRSRAVQGLDIAWGLEFNSASHRWQGGDIYDPGSGNTYSCELGFKSEGASLFRPTLWGGRIDG